MLVYACASYLFKIASQSDYRLYRRRHCTERLDHFMVLFCCYWCVYQIVILMVQLSYCGQVAYMRILKKLQLTT